MVASVAKRGYVATRVADLVELSGVSSRAFYRLFPDKRACFLATVEALLPPACEDGTEAAAPWEQRALRGAESFVELIVSQPAAARMCLIEAYAAGPKVTQKLENAAARAESRVLRLARESPERSAIPEEMASAYVGAIQEVARTRLRQGRESELPDLIDELLPLALSYRPPPEPLRLTTRRTAAVSEPQDAYDHAERILRAMTAVAAERGYAEATVEQVVKQAGISGSMFYAHFQSKDDALLAAIDSAGAQIVAAIMPAFRRGSDWPQGVRTALGGLLNFLASRPALARLLMVEAYAGGPAALAHREEALRPLQPLFSEGRKLAPNLGPVAFEAIAGGIYYLAHKQIRDSGPESLPALAPVCTYIALAPFVGADEACAAANGDGRFRGSQAPDAEASRAIAGEPIRQKVLNILSDHAATLREIADELGQAEAAVRDDLNVLERIGLVEVVERRGDAAEHLYKSNMGVIHTEPWDRLNPAERQQISAQVDQLIRSDLDRSMASGTFDARPERVQVRIPHIVDEQGWQELSELYAETVTAALEIHAKSSERLEASEESGIDARTVLALFEVPS
jgi:AcrR family transcriptional regulator